MNPKKLMNVRPKHLINLRTKGCYKVIEGYCYGAGTNRFLGEAINFPFKKQKETQWSYRKIFLLNKIKDIVKS